MNFKTHKDKLPQNTINEIRNILTDLGIFTIEKRWHSVTDNCYSVNLSFDAMQCFSNGKGISEEYALASAYAEFIERLQADFLIEKEFGLMKKDTFNYPDDVEMTLGSYAEKNKSVIENIVNPMIIDKYRDLKIKCFPSYEVIEEKVKYLPYFIRAAVMSNGLCAGNTAEEAICQGICETFERFVIREIYYNKNIDLPTIPLSVLKKLEIYEIINKIIKKGYWLIIKDCTLGGKLPVVGVILMNKNKNSYLYKFGSDTIFEVALQRCLTELFQGINENSLNRSFLNQVDFSDKYFFNKHFSSEVNGKKYNFQSSLNFGNDILPSYIFTTKNETTNFKNGFQDEFKNHRDSLFFLKNIIKKNNYKLYIQNISYLGFPSYKIFIPELSWSEKIYLEKFSAYFAEINFIKEVLLGLKKASAKDIEKCANILETLVCPPDDYLRYRLSDINYFTKIIIEKSSHFTQLFNLEYLLGMLFFRTGNYEKAFKYMNQYIKEFGKEFANLDYYNCVLLYLRLKSEKLSDNEISLILKNMFGEDLSKEAINDLGNTEECFKYFLLPECGDCSLCPIKKECRYEKWKEINDKIVSKIKSNPINQEDMSKVFK